MPTASAPTGWDRCCRWSPNIPLSLPGYYYQEISAKEFVLVGGNYIVPLDRSQRWNVSATASTAVVDYLPGLEQPGNWQTGVGGGVLYKSPSWKVMVGYGYGVDAMRSHGRGAQSVGVLLQFDLGHVREGCLIPRSPAAVAASSRCSTYSGSRPWCKGRSAKPEGRTKSEVLIRSRPRQLTSSPSGLRSLDSGVRVN